MPTYIKKRIKRFFVVVFLFGFIMLLPKHLLGTPNMAIIAEQQQEQVLPEETYEDDSEEAVNAFEPMETIYKQTVRIKTEKINAPAQTQSDYEFLKCTVKYGFNQQAKVRAIEYIVVHSTDNPDVDSASHIKWLNRDKSANAVHYYIDATSIRQALDEDIQAWGVGDAIYPNAIRNNNSIQIEICEYSDPIKQQQAIDNAASFIKNDLLKRHPNAQIVKHQDASGKYCPRVLLNNKYDWLMFLGNIQGVSI